MRKEKRWKCSGGDLNPHALRHTPLKRTCLPFHHPSDGLGVVHSISRRPRKGCVGGGGIAVTGTRFPRNEFSPVAHSLFPNARIPV